jgi:hypothetical protein
MNKSVEKIIKHRKNYYSQSGEDGLLEYLLSKLPQKTKWCVEFGAWDGIYLSNTYYFISKHNYKSVLIEADPVKFETLQNNLKKYESICFNRFVEIFGENTLDNILKLTPIPKEFDLLSIDVDGNDYQIWNSLNNYQPKIIIIEINPRDKPSVERISVPNSPVTETYGTSIYSMTKLAKTKGYCLLAHVACNAVYIKKEYLNIFYKKEPTPYEVFTYENHRLMKLTLQDRKNLGWKRVLEKFHKSYFSLLKSKLANKNK